MYIFIIATFVVIVILLSLYIFLLKEKIEELEIKIIKLFKIRSSFIPVIHDITKIYLDKKHSYIFNRILDYKKEEFISLSYKNSLYWLLEIELKIHNEFNLIFKILNKNPLAMKDGKILYIEDLILESSNDIWKSMDRYKKIIMIYNNYIKIKNWTIIWILIPIKKKDDYL